MKFLTLLTALSLINVSAVRAHGADNAAELKPYSLFCTSPVQDQHIQVEVDPAADTMVLSMDNGPSNELLLTLGALLLERFKLELQYTCSDVNNP